MAVIVCNKSNEIVDIFEDEHKFSAHELATFLFIKVTGYKKDELNARLPYPKLGRAWRLPIANQWTFDEPEKQNVWFDEEGSQWKALVEKQHHALSLAPLTQNELDILASDTMPGMEKEKILSAKIINNIKSAAANSTVISELGIVSG
jgi:hypothetical protein